MDSITDFGVRFPRIAGIVPRSVVFVLLLCAPLLMGQTAAVAPQIATTTAAKVPAQTIVITIPKMGGKLSFVIPGQTLAPLTATVPGQSAPISLSGMTGSFSCDYDNSTVTTNPNGTKTITATCSIVTK